MIEHGRVSVDNRGDHEEGIKDADAQKIPSRPEMRHPLLFGRVIDACGHGNDAYAFPSAAYKQFQLGLVAQQERSHPLHGTQRIETEAVLRIAQASGG